MDKKEKKEKKAASVVSSAIFGMDYATVIVNGKAYVIMPPTIHKLSGVGYYFSELSNGNSIKEILQTMGDMRKAANILSILIEGDISLADELSEGTFEEVVLAIDEGLSLINAEVFMKLSALRRSVLMLTAKPKP